jgi:cytochrome c-type biogenesis protein CcsB
VTKSKKNFKNEEFMNKILNILTSMRLAAALLLAFAASCAVATFVENDHGTQTARALIYNTHWFEALQGLLAVQVAVMMIRFKSYLRPKTPVFALHVSFLLIVLGSALTRYAGYEGMLHVREGEVQNKMLSSDTYLVARNKADGKILFEKAVLFPSIGEPSFGAKFDAFGKSAQLDLKSFVPNAVKTVEESANGKPILSLVVSTPDDEPFQKILAYGDFFEYGDTVFSLGVDTNASAKKSVKFSFKDGKFYYSTSSDVKTIAMADRYEESFKANDTNEFSKGKLYSMDSVSFVPRALFAKGEVKIVRQKLGKKMRGGDDMLEFALTLDGVVAPVSVKGQVGGAPEFATVKTAVGELEIGYGAKEIVLPFALKLNKFTLERYPGSQSPSSYKSSVDVLAGEQKLFDYEIYMNHTLDHGGYRFFQSSYDMDERGTVLSVSKDPGKIPTYVGYLALAFGMLASFFNKNGRFAQLNGMLNGAKAVVVGLLLFVSVGADLRAEQNSTKDMASQIADSFKPIDKRVSDKFGSLMVQDAQGRIKPVNTLAIDILDKVYGKSTVMGMDANQALLSMLIQPKNWQYVKMIKITHPELKKALALPEGENRAAFNDIFEMQNNQLDYRLARAVDDANKKRPADRDTLDKDVLKIDERVNVCYMVFTGQLLKIFPKPNDDNNTWYDPATSIMGFEPSDGSKIKAMMGGFFEAIDMGKADEALKFAEEMNQYQKTVGAKVYPSDGRVGAEIFYNKAEVFKNLIYVYLLIGFALLGIEIAKIAKPDKDFKKATLILWGLLGAGFVAHTANLGLRWYISGHAPWSDGFESMTYIAWATILAGFIFSKKSPISFALTGILSGVLLFVAHLSWMDPQITNIVPVLKSYWLTIHVSMITASYGFLALGALIGFVCLVLFIFRREDRPHVDRTIKELAIINEMTLIVGLMMLTIGNFLGGVWANESWGRYWGWDPKETWALISILIYAIVVHYRFIPGLKSLYAFSVLSTVAISSVVMTYFGVNFYLSGLHSYASGDPVPIPTFVWAFVAVVAITIFFASKNRELER